MAAQKTNWVLWGGLAAGAAAAWYFLTQKTTTTPLIQSASLQPFTVPQPPVTQVDLAPNGISVTNADGTTTTTNSPAHAATLLSNAAISPSTVLAVHPLPLLKPLAPIAPASTAAPASSSSTPAVTVPKITLRAL